MEVANLSNYAKLLDDMVDVYSVLVDPVVAPKVGSPQNESVSPVSKRDMASSGATSPFTWRTRRR